VTRALRYVGVLLASGLILWGASIGLVLVAGARPVVRRADAILVMGAAQWNGRPSPVLRARLDYALSLYRRGLGRRLIFTGGVGAGDTLSEGEVARRYALQKHIPDTVILVEREGATSAESMEAAAQLMRSQSLQSALLVSDPSHMLRLELLARTLGIRAYRAPTPMSPIERDAPTRRRYVLRESLLFPGFALVLGR
jgi:uncharacterized SAM-binding protein YcdF (DUF218 family)